MNEAETNAVEAQLRETRRRLSEASEFYGSLPLQGQMRDELREAMRGYALATTRIMDLLACAIKTRREPSAQDDAEIQRNHRIRFAAMATLMDIAAQASDVARSTAPAQPSALATRVHRCSGDHVVRNMAGTSPRCVPA